MIISKVRRDLYVPIPKAATDKRRAPTRPVPHSERIPSGVAFRAVAWTGEQREARSSTSDLRDASPPLDVRAVEAFGAISWTGKPPRPMTAKQSARSVRATLESFRWE
jgi:hypothetical protein